MIVCGSTVISSEITIDGLQAIRYIIVKGKILKGILAVYLLNKMVKKDCMFTSRFSECDCKMILIISTQLYFMNMNMTFQKKKIWNDLVDCGTIKVKKKHKY